MNRTKLYNIFLSITTICLVLSTLLAFFTIKSFLFKVFFFSFLLILFVAWFSKQSVLASSESKSPYCILITVMSILILGFIICAAFTLGRLTISHLL